MFFRQRPEDLAFRPLLRPRQRPKLAHEPAAAHRGLLRLLVSADDPSRLRRRDHRDCNDTDGYLDCRAHPQLARVCRSHLLHPEHHRCLPGQLPAVVGQDRAAVQCVDDGCRHNRVCHLVSRTIGRRG
jgi:hypothetical protein